MHSILKRSGNLRVLVLTLCFLAPAVGARGNDDGAGMLMRVLLDISSRHPAVRGRAEELASKLSRADYASYFYPDPKLGLVYSNLPSGRFVYDRTPMTGIELQLRQPVPFPGRLSLRARIADDEAESARLALARTKNVLARDYLLAEIDIDRLTRLVRLTENYGRQMRIISETARTGYAVGRGTLSDLTRANLARSRYQVKGEEYAGRLDGMRERRAYFFTEGDDSKSAASATKASEVTPPEPSPRIPRAELRAWIAKITRWTANSAGQLEAMSLELAVARIAERSGERKASLARYDYLPDFELFAAYRQRDEVQGDPVSGEDFASVGLSIRLPLWSALNNHRQVRAAKQERTARAHALQNMRGRLMALDAEHDARLRSLAERIKTYRVRLIPQARRAVTSSRLAYGTGGVDFDTLLDSRDTLYNLKAEAIELETARDRLVVKRAALYNLVLSERETEENDE